MKKILSSAGLTALLATFATTAFAHHPLDGETPTTITHGLLSGIGHPIIGFDHLAFVVAVGILAAFKAKRFLTPLAFVGATLAGCMMKFGGIELPFAELAIAASIAVIGASVASGMKLSTPVLAAFFALAGIFHGWAYGEAIVGAEATPLVSYLIGFGATQYLIALAMGAVALFVWKAGDLKSVQTRIAGAVVLGVGLTFLIENVEGMIF